MAERDVDRTPSKTRDAGTIDQADVLQTDYNTTHSSMASAHVDDDAHGPDVAIQSAYTAPPYPRPQAERDDMAGLGELSASHDNRKRGDLTAHNLEMIPDADQVAPGIRLGREGNEGYDQAAQDATRYREAQIAPREASHVHEHDHLMDQHGGDHEEVGSDVGGDGGADSHDQHRSVRHMPGEDVESIKAPSSVGAQGSSSTGHGAGLDVDDDDDDDDGLHEAGGEQQRAGIVHERVGGSGATSENASKGASVGHFGPRGEAIPGVPPHLDPRQPNFRPPSPGAASVLSVAVHPPASPKALGPSGLGASASAVPPEGETLMDSGDETESFDNGALTPTLSDDDIDMDSDNFHDADDADLRDRRGSPTPGPEVQSSSPSSTRALGPFSSLQVESNDSHRSSGHDLSSSSRARGRDLFGIPAGSSSSLSYPSSSSLPHRASISGSVGGTPSVAATAGSSRAPSTRGLSPSAPLSREMNGDADFIENDGSSMSQDDLDRSNSMGAETPSLSRKSSFESSPSSASALAPREEPTNQTHADTTTAMDAALVRTRGGTLTAAGSASGLGLGLTGAGPGGSSLPTAAGIGGDEEGSVHEGEGDAPSLAPSEAGSDSTRSVNVESSLGHGQTHNVLDRGAAGPSNTSSLAQQRLASSSYSLLTPSSMPPPSSSTATLPSLLALKEAARKQQGSSRAASTAATNGTTSPASSLSIDGSIAGDEEYFDSSTRDEVTAEA